ncbi:MAG: hypothetical protein ACOZEN_02490 [Thermodesulfobacteriota bacterium]
MRKRAFLTAFFSLIVLAGTVRAEPVNFKELIPLISIKVPGWTAGEPTGQTVKSPVEASEATIEFTKDDMTLEVAIFDGGPAMAAAMAATAQVEMESTEEVVKPVTVKGYKGSLYLHLKDKEADLVIMVPSRFAVSLQLRGSMDGELLKSVAGQIDLDKLATLGK